MVNYIKNFFIWYRSRSQSKWPVSNMNKNRKCEFHQKNKAYCMSNNTLCYKHVMTDSTGKEKTGKYQFFSRKYISYYLIDNKAQSVLCSSKSSRCKSLFLSLDFQLNCLNQVYIVGY